MVACIMTGCDEGDIYPQTAQGSRTVNAQIYIKGVTGWPSENYSLTLALFKAEETIPTDTVSFTKVNEGNRSTATISSVPDEVTTAAICLVRKRTKEVVYTFASDSLSTVNDLTILKVTDIDLLTHDRLQSQLFNQCIQCHGASSGTPQANLNLTSDYSYEQLVNHAAKNSSVKNRVQAGFPAQSFILDVLSGEATSSLSRPFNHSTGISSLTTEDVELLEAWIKNLK